MKHGCVLEKKDNLLSDGYEIALLDATETKQTSELYRPRDRRLSAKLVLTFADRGCCVVSATDPNSRILDF
jgi:hypothetical protein